MQAALWPGGPLRRSGCLPLPTRHLSGSEVLAFRDAAFREYFGGQRYQSMVERTFGPAVLGEVKAMLGEPLARDHVRSERPVVVGSR